MSAPTLRSLSRTPGVSRTTISEALRGSSRVRPATAERIRAAAEAAGYHHNPLAGAIMSELRRSRGELIRGARERAAGVGFEVECFAAGTHSLPLRRPRFRLTVRSRRAYAPAPNVPPFGYSFPRSLAPIRCASRAQRRGDSQS